MHLVLRCFRPPRAATRDEKVGFVVVHFFGADVVMMTLFVLQGASGAGKRAALQAAISTQGNHSRSMLLLDESDALKMLISLGKGGLLLEVGPCKSTPSVYLKKGRGSTRTSGVTGTTAY